MYLQPDFVHDNPADADQEGLRYYRAEVHLTEGGQDYDIMSWSVNVIINDVIDQYHKHMHFLHLLR